MAADVLTLPKFNDMHVHLREGSAARKYLKVHQAYCTNILAMPNTSGPGLNTVDRVMEYVHGLDTDWPGLHVALKIDSETTQAEIRKAKECRHILAAKLYPDGVTTNSSSGLTLESITDGHLNDVFKAMQEVDLPLCIHGELPKAFCLERESRFVTYFLSTICDRFPTLRIVLEHISTKEAVRFVSSRYRDGHRIAATITPHHLLLTLDHVVGDTLQPHNFCKPIAKTEQDQDALIGAALSGLPCFFLGSDSAPHMVVAKERDCGCAGCFTGPIVPELLMPFFEDLAAHRVVDFTSRLAAKFYDLDSNIGNRFKIYKRTRVMLTPKESGRYDQTVVRVFIPPQGKLYWSRENTDQPMAALLNCNGELWHQPEPAHLDTVK